MDFDRVVDGIVRYLNREILKGMNQWQDMMARIAMSRILSNRKMLREALINTPFLQTIGVIDSRGMVDVEGLANDLREQIREKGKLTIALPLFGNFTFVESDVDELYRAIMEG
jgi:hypothetical protein